MLVGGTRLINLSFRLDEKDVVKSDCSDDERLMNSQAAKQPEDDFENELDISDDSDW